jgi:hypothetical protein
MSELAGNVTKQQKLEIYWLWVTWSTGETRMNFSNVQPGD